MDVRLFFSTFILIFLAELGDKTQLTALAASAGAKSPWSVFAGASLALVLSTLLAILLGSVLQRLIPPQWIKGGAAVLFFVFGAVLLMSALRAPAAAVTAAPPSAPAEGLMARVVVNAAARFERASAEDYERLAAGHPDPEVRALFGHLAAEERRHLEHVRRMTFPEADTRWELASDIPAAGVIDRGRQAGDVIERAIEHERQTAAFYRQMSKTANIRSARQVFAALAAEEDSHVAHLEAYRER